MEGEFPWLIKLPNDAIAPAPQGQLGFGATYFAASGTKGASAILKQAFVRFKGLAGDKASSLRVGRFEFDLSADFNVTQTTVLTFYASGVRGGGVQGFVYPSGGDNPAARFIYVELTQRF